VKHFSKKNSGNQKAAFLLDIIKKTIDLKVFIEREGPTTLRPEGTNAWNGLCPLHKDGDPSFWVRRKDDGLWIYHCFGCNSGGTIVDFCLERYGLLNVYEAALFAAEKEGVKCDATLIAKAIQEAKVQTDAQKEMNLAHFVACESCRRLIRMVPDDETMLWAAKTFVKMNKLINDPNTKAEAFNNIREEACHKMELVCKL
jgi:hypothetical protein